MKPYILAAAAAVGMFVSAGSVEAQGLSLALRGGGNVPLGAFAEASATHDGFVAGAKSGFGLGLDATLSLGSALGLYAGFDQVNFDCETARCTDEGSYDLAGFTAGVKLQPMRIGPVSPWLKGGVTFTQLQGEYGGASSVTFKTDRAPGYEIGAGFELPILGFASISPQVRYVGQQLKYRLPGVESPAPERQSATYLSFDLGLSVGSPFGGMRR